MDVNCGLQLGHIRGILFVLKAKRWFDSWPLPAEHGKANAKKKCRAWDAWDSNLESASLTSSLMFAGSRGEKIQFQTLFVFTQFLHSYDPMRLLSELLHFSHSAKAWLQKY